MEIRQFNQKYIHDHQLAAFTMLMKFVVVSGIIFFILNFIREKYTFAIIELVVVFIVLIMLKKIKTTTDFASLQKLFVVSMVIFFALSMSFIYNEASSKSIYVWMFMYPPLSYTILGKQKGFIVSTVFILLALGIIFKDGNRFDFVEPVAIFNIIVCTLVIWVNVHNYEHSNSKIKKKLSELSIKDNLTAIYNRSALSSIQDELGSSQYCLTILDIDLFKKINDVHGHDIGDKALQFFCKKMKLVFDENSYLVRLGGEEFCIITPNIPLTNIQSQLVTFYDELKENLLVVTSTHSEEISIAITFSAGVAESSSEETNFSDLLKLADERMYAAKKSGRNCIVSE